MVVRFPEFRPRTLIRSAAHNVLVNTLFNGVVGESLALLVTGVSDAINAAATFRNRNAAGAHIRAQHSQTGATVFEVTDSGVHGTIGGSFDPRAFGAVGDGAHDDTAGLDAAWAAAQAAGGGVVEVPPGVWLYSGFGFFNNPVYGVDAPLLLRGAGPSMTRLVFQALTTDQAIYLGSQTPVGGFLNMGQGVQGMTIECPVGKDAIRIEHVEAWTIRDVVINQCKSAILIYDTRFGQLDHVYIYNYRGVGLGLNRDATGPVHECSWINDLQITGGAPTTGWGVEVILGAAPTGNNGTYMKQVVVNHSSFGGMLFSTAGASHDNGILAYLVGCVADSGNFTEPAFRVSHGRFVYFTDCWAYCLLPGKAAVDLDAAAYVSWIGGHVANGHGSAGAGGSGFDLKNGCLAITLKPSHLLAGGAASGVTGIASSAGAAPQNVDFAIGYQQGLAQMIAPNRLLSAADTARISGPTHITTSPASVFTEFALLDDGGTHAKYLRFDDATGDLQVVNAAHSQVLFTLTNGGAITAIGSVVAGALQSGSEVIRQRRRSTGTTQVAGNIVASAGFGSTRSVTAISGGDDHFRFDVTAGGTGLANNPTITVTFRDGAYAAAPQATVVKFGSYQPSTPVVWSTTTTTLTITFAGTPVAGEVYEFSCMTTGR